MQGNLAAIAILRIEPPERPRKKEEKVLAEGDTMPTLTILDDAGAPVETRALLGKKLVLWFYPKDDTPG
jgi:hypothetical protein